MLQHSAKKLVFFILLQYSLVQLVSFSIAKGRFRNVSPFLYVLNQIKTSSSLTHVGTLRMFKQVYFYGIGSRFWRFWRVDVSKESASEPVWVEYQLDGRYSLSNSSGFNKSWDNNESSGSFSGFRFGSVTELRLQKKYRLGIGSGTEPEAVCA